MQAVLSIIVPTFNRAERLDSLLNFLISEVGENNLPVEIIVGNNGSTDATLTVIEKRCSNCAFIQIINHPENLGPDENFSQCVDLVKTPFFWFMGDDDTPLSGVLVNIVKLLIENTPDVVYLANKWVPGVPTPDKDHAAPFLWQMIDRIRFAEMIHVWFTFISGIIIRTDTWKAAKIPPRKFSATNLIQLGWVFGALSKGTRFIHVSSTCVRATAGNSGGYEVMRVFGVNYPRIVAEFFAAERKMVRALMGGFLSNYLPGLAWSVRSARAGKFSSSMETGELKKSLGTYWRFRLVVVPIMAAPKWIAQLIFWAVKGYSRIRKIFSGKRI
ncbi:glycosyltransferase [Xylophilus sp. Kf1]|nr:glycosyltransferase [Xylophilus sp. Kf1]